MSQAGSNESDAAAESTQALLRRAGDGDGQALDVLARRYLGPLRRFARGRLPAWARDAMETDDLVQETLLKTLRRAEHFEAEHTGAFHGYLRTAVLNQIRDELRRVSRRPLVGGSAGSISDPAPSPLEEAIGKEALERYERALAELDPLEREAIHGRIELGLPWALVAESLGKPSPDAARMIVSRAVARLARAMSDEPRPG